MNTAQLLEWDREHLWHPYTSTVDPLPVYPVRTAHRCTIELEDGTQLIDGMSSWWCAIHGYNNPTLNAALHAQIDQLSHVMFGGLTHRPAVELGKLLTDHILPTGMDQIFYSDSGSVSIEVAMKMAIQYHISRGDHQRLQFATIRSGYHGDTWHAMSVCDPVTGMHGLFGSALRSQYFVPQPRSRFGAVWDDDDLQPMRDLLHRRGGEIAAIIVEPIVQGAGGMYFYHPEYLNALRAMADEYGALLIFDEIATGFGRTGQMLATNWCQILPDIITLGKSLTGGYMTFALTATTKQIADTISGGEAGCFMHGPTFMGNPLACSISIASIQLLLSQDWQERVRAIEQQLRSGLAPLSEHPSVQEVRCLGAIGVVEMKEPVDMRSLIPDFVTEGIWIRPFGRLIYLEPQFMAIHDDELQTLITGMVKVIRRQYR